MADTPGGGFPLGYGSYVNDNGETFALAVGKTKQLEEAQEQAISQFKATGWENVKLKMTQVSVGYVLDGADKPPPRSGEFVVIYKFKMTFTGTLKGKDREDVRWFQPKMASVFLESENFKTMDLRKTP